jgi:hypothetical protein
METISTRQNGPIPFQNQRHRENLVPHEPWGQKGNEEGHDDLETPKAVQYTQVQEAQRHDPPEEQGQNTESILKMADTVQPHVSLLQGEAPAD